MNTKTIGPSFGELLGLEIREAREARGWTQLDLALTALGDENAGRRIRDYESGKVKRPQAKVYQPICEALGITRRRIGELKAQAADSKSVSDDDIAALRAEKGSLEQALSDLRTLSRFQLETLAGRFEYAQAYDATDGALIEFLTEKARDYRALKSEVDAIEDGLKRLSNLKSAARAAIDAGDLDEVEEILSRVQEVELDEAAKTAELRANNALLRGRTEQAFRIFSAAADSFAAVDPMQTSERKLSCASTLYAYGLRYGDNANIYAAQMIRDTLNLIDRETNPHLWGSAQNNLGLVLQVEGSRTAGAAGADLLAQAVDAYRAALTVRTHNAHPVQWAMAQSNLGLVLKAQGSRTDGPAGADLLAQAVAAYRAALTIFTRDAHPVDWAMTQNNLAGALQSQGNRTDGPAGTGLLTQAVTAYRAALEVITRDAHPVDWAQTQNNLGAVLSDQGNRTDGRVGAHLLAQAVIAYRAALEVYTRDAHPVDWAMTLNNLGNALSEQGTRTDGPAGADLLTQAVAAYRGALKVRTRNALPLQWAMTQNNLGEAFEALAEHGTCDDPHKAMQQAINHASAALDVFDPETTGFYFDYVSKVKARIDAKIAAIDTQ